MGKTDYVGIDYGLGRTNVDGSTGIRFGVISQHSVGQAWYDQSEADYGKPSCPKCGNEVEDAIKEDTHLLHCDDCEYDFDTDEAYGDEPIGWNYEGDGYVLTDCLDNDIMVLKSPFYTFAQFCSPCVPGAGNLDTPFVIQDPDKGTFLGCEPITNPDYFQYKAREAGFPKSYCLGHDWFEEDEAPYPVYSVETGKQVKVVKNDVSCPNCNGTGRDTVSRLASVRGVCRKELLDQITDGTFSGHLKDFAIVNETFLCFRCDGKGIVIERSEIEE